MRTVYFLSGMPGSGKSTLISKNELEGLTLSLDTFRQIYSGLNSDHNGNMTISQDKNDFVFKLFLEALELRLQLGSPIIIDNLNPSLKDIETALKIVKTYDYEYKIVEFPLQELDFYINRNNNRPPYKRLSENKIELLHSVFKNRAFNEEDIISVIDFEKEIIAGPKELIKDVSHYNKIHFFGDLQGSFSPLNEYFKKNRIDKNDLYVFLGDYIDRGIENAKCLEFVLENLYKPNFIFIMGNHEENLYKYSNDLNKLPSNEFLDSTLPELIDNNIDKSKMKEIYRGLKLFEFLQFKDKKIFISHGGLSSVPQKPRMLNHNEYLRGYGPYTFNVDEQFDKLNKDNEWYQIHGHRNHHKLTFNSYKKSFTLESDVEFGGNLSVLRLDENGFNGIYIQNKIFNKELILKIEKEKDMFKIKASDNNLTSFITNKVNYKKNGLEIIEELRNNKLIKESNFQDYPHISSFNFTRTAFLKKQFDEELVVKARGLFFNNQNGDIIARGFEKFFNINESGIEDTKNSNLESNFKMPLSLFQKENGFLGIIGYDKSNNSLVFCSKSNIGGEFANNFEQIIKNQLTEGEIEYLKIFANRHNINYLFEVNDSLKDPHIIEYEKPHVVLLSIVKRELRYSEMNYENLISFSENFKNLPVKNKLINFNDFKSFNGFINSIKKESSFSTKRAIEGYVVQDSNLNMVKVKTPYYNFWKAMRVYTTQLNISESKDKIFDIDNRIKNNDFINLSDKQNAIDFLNFFKELPEDKRNKSIIDLRNDFIQKNKNKNISTIKIKP